MSSTTPWTQDRIETLARLWREGRSAAAIAQALGGVTRNAVLGKIHRLGLSGRARPARPGSGLHRTESAGRRRARPRRRVVPPPAAAPGPPADPPPEAGLADMRTVGPHACRWPLGDPRAPGFSVCGRPVARGAYCAAHGALAYRPTARDHLLRLAGLA